MHAYRRICVPPQRPFSFMMVTCLKIRCILIHARSRVCLINAAPFHGTVILPVSNVINFTSYQQNLVQPARNVPRHLRR